MKIWLSQFWHQYVLGHSIIRNHKWFVADEGKPWMCTCGKEWK